MPATSGAIGGLQREASSWQQARQRAHKLCHDIVNLRNKSTYLTSNKVHAAVGTATLPTASLALLHEDLANRVQALRAAHEDMYNSLDRMATLQFEVFPEANVVPPALSSTTTTTAAAAAAAAPITYESFATLRDQLQQQTFLECCIAEDLCRGTTPANDGGGDDDGEDRQQAPSAAVHDDQDALTTMLACLTYPPYLREPDLAAFLALPPS